MRNAPRGQDAHTKKEKPLKNENLFGTALRRLRRAKEMSLVDLADAIDHSVVYISDIERGKRNPPTPKKIRKLLQVMGEEGRYAEMLSLAIRSRRSVEFPIQGKNAPMTDMLVALARRCDEDTLDQSLIEKLKRILDGKESE
jgi:transcriptional regulator with XRE-family HTH domain